MSTGLTLVVSGLIRASGSHHVDTWEQVDPGIDMQAQLTPWFAGWAGSGWYQTNLQTNDGGMSRLGLTTIYWVCVPPARLLPRRCAVFRVQSATLRTLVQVTSDAATNFV